MVTLTKRRSSRTRDGRTRTHHHRARWPVGRSEEGRFLELLSARPLWHPVDLGILDVHGAPGVARVDGEGPLGMPFQSFIPTGSHEIVLRAPSGEETSLDVDIVAGQTRVIDAASLRPRTPTRRACRDRPRPSRASRRRAQAARGRPPAEALRVYRRIERDFATSPRPPWCSSPSASSRCDKDRRRVRSPAFDGYLRRGGPLSPEAYKGRIDALHALGKTAEERSAIETYLAKYPDGFDREASRSAWPS